MPVDNFHNTMPRHMDSVMTAAFVRSLHEKPVSAESLGMIRALRDIFQADCAAHLKLIDDWIAEAQVELDNRQKGLNEK